MADRARYTTEGAGRRDPKFWNGIGPQIFIGSDVVASPTIASWCLPPELPEADLGFEFLTFLVTYT